MNIFPNEGSPTFTGEHNNILNIEIPYGGKGDQYMELLSEKAIPFIKEFAPELIIVCAGYDALAVDPLANVRVKL